MLTHPTTDRLEALGFTGMAKALDEQRRANDTFCLDGRESAKTALRFAEPCHAAQAEEDYGEGGVG